MIRKDKVFELKIEEDDDISGIDSISLVDEPAIDVMWIAFNKEKEHEFHIPEGEDEKYLTELLAAGIPESEVFEEGFEVYKIENVTREMFSDPNAASKLDDEFLVRFKYAKNPDAPGPSIKETTRDFCREVISQDLVYRIEDITNEYGETSLRYRGGYNCRHLWQRILYKRTADIGSATGTKGRVYTGPSYTIPGVKQPSTVVPSRPSFSKEKNNFSYPLFETIEEAELYAIEIGCEGHHEHIIGDVTLYMPCKEHPEDMGYDVGTIGGYVDPGIKKKRKKIIEKSVAKPTLFDKKAQYFAADSEKQMVLGPAMIPNQKIFRKDQDGSPYYVYFSPETIKMIASKYMKNKYTDNNDQMHDGEAVKDVYVVESWIKESNNDKSTDYGFGDLPIGTWFVSMKINNLDIWSKVKDKQLNGFSVSGFFEEVAAFKREEMFLQKVAEILANIKD